MSRTKNPKAPKQKVSALPPAADAVAEQWGTQTITIDTTNVIGGGGGGGQAPAALDEMSPDPENPKAVPPPKRPASYPTWIYTKDGAFLVKSDDDVARAIRVYNINSDGWTEREWHDSPAKFAE